jgi:hypothetical protein
MAVPGFVSVTVRDDGSFRWLAGDHHIHTQYSPDGLYRVVDHVRQALACGLDWMVITDHGSRPHVKIGLEKVNRDITHARAEFEDMLIFQGLEWNVPAADHGTVFVHPGEGEVAVLKEFGNAFDRAMTDATGEALAVAGVEFLARAVSGKRVADALFLANHPSNKGIVSPHQLRTWRDTDPHIAVGMEAAPGHQAAGIRKPFGRGRHRGSYDKAPGPGSFAGYPPESYRTHGGFDWMTATVGGVWDSLLAEGRPWWVTANSDVHDVHGDVAYKEPGSDFDRDGRMSHPASGSTSIWEYGDFWPGQYSRTHVGARDVGYAAVMEGIRRGRIWVDHGHLVDGLDVRLRVKGTGAGVTLGGTLSVARDRVVELVVKVDLATRPNGSRAVPTLTRVDVIAGEVTGAVADRDTFIAPNTKVVRSYDTSMAAGTVTLTYDVGRVDRPMYVRLRGTDGNRAAPGLLGASVDPAGPAQDVPGDADPWRDLWFYTNPIWIVPR